MWVIEMEYRKRNGKNSRQPFAGVVFGVLVAGAILLLKAGIVNGGIPGLARGGAQDVETYATEGHGTELAGFEHKNPVENAPDFQEKAGAKDTEAIEAAVLEQEYQRVLGLSAGELVSAGIVREELADRLFYAAGIDEAVLGRINGKSYTPNETVLPADLSYLRMLYFGPDQNTYVGEMIVNQAIEADILEIFQTLYENRYPIERMVLVDDYDADDEASMQANNTSAFNYRTIAGSSRLSNHSYGMAVDVNPKYNPYVKTDLNGGIACQPKGSEAYADRGGDFLYKIDEQDLAYKLFTDAGFTWGGSWDSVKDYQHFEKTRSSTPSG